MEEKKPQVEEKKEELKEETNLERAERLNKSLEENIVKNAELLRKIDAANAEKLLAGTGGAGIPEPDKKVMTPKEYKDYVMKYGKAPE